MEPYVLMNLFEETISQISQVTTYKPNCAYLNLEHFTFIGLTSQRQIDDRRRMLPESSLDVLANIRQSKRTIE